MDVTEAALKTILTRYGIMNNGYGRCIPHPDRRKYLDKHFNYLRRIVPGTPYKTVLKKFNEKFGFSINLLAFRTLCKKYGIQNGFLGYFPKGNVPFNKGMKGNCAPGSEKGWFKKGHMPFNTMPIGSERITEDGYVEIKYSDRKGSPSRRWKGKQVIIWEKANGAVPKSHVIVFADGNRRNFKLSNLILVSRKELVVLNHTKHLTKNKDYNKALVALSKLQVAIADRKRDSFKSGKKSLVIIDNTGKRCYVIMNKETKRFYPIREMPRGLYKFKNGFKPRKTRAEAQRDLKEYAMKRGWQRE
jgi:hypothetical protein